MPLPSFQSATGRYYAKPSGKHRTSESKNTESNNGSEMEDLSLRYDRCPCRASNLTTAQYRAECSGKLRTAKVRKCKIKIGFRLAREGSESVGKLLQTATTRGLHGRWGSGRTSMISRGWGRIEFLLELEPHSSPQPSIG